MNYRECFNITHELVDNLNIIFNKTNRMIVFWNSFQILVLEESSLEQLQDISKWVIIHDTDSDVVSIILTNNYILYLDKEGNVYDYPLKLKHSASKKPKSSFKLTINNVLCMDWNKEFLYTLKKTSDELYIYVYALNFDFPIYKKIDISTLLLTKIQKHELCIFHCYEINEIEYNCLKTVLNEKSNWENQIFIIMCLNRLTLYGMLVSCKSPLKGVTPIKLMTCPSEINDINFIKDNLCLIISLNVGTIINLPLSSHSQTANTVHLNTAIQKFVPFNNTALYTDGITMWKATQIFSENDIKLQQLFVTQVKDFTNIGDKIICTTYSKLIYIFDLDNETSYLVPVDDSEYYPAKHLLNNSNYLDKIMEEIEKSDDIIKNIVKEENYITTLALSNRQDILNDIIQYNVLVYENYQDVLKEGIVLNLTHNIEEYNDPQSFCFLVKMTITSIPPDYRNILSNIFNDFRIYINIISDQKVSMTVSINVTEPLKSMNILIPCLMSNTKEATCYIKLVSKIPGVLDERQLLWITLHSRCVNLMSEHFIKLDKVEPVINSGNIRLLKKRNDSVQDIIYKSTFSHFGHLFKLSNITEYNNPIHWKFYIKLPVEYKETLLNRTFFNEHFCSVKAKLFLKQLSSEEFLKSKSNICFSVGNDNIDLKIINDGFSTPLISVCCENASIGLSVRNFFSNLINNYQNLQPGQVFLSSPPHTAIENTNKAVKNCRIGQTSFEDFYKILDQYQQNVIAELI